MPTCGNILKKCDAALEAQKEQIKIRDLELVQFNDLLNAKDKELENLKKSQDRWYNQKWIWILVGAGTTAYLMKK